MKIQRASVLSFSRRLDGKAWNPAFRWTERRAPLLVIEFDNGVRGIGEAWSGYRGVEDVLRELCQTVAPALIGISINDQEDIAGAVPSLANDLGSRERAAAWSAADIALWDACGHHLAKPVWQLLGGSVSKAPVYASAGLYRDDYSLDDLRDEARSYRREGFKAMKMKVCGVSLEEDLKRIGSVRAGLGPDATIWVDAVNQLSVESAKSFWQAIKGFDVKAVQSPLPPSDMEGMCQLNQGSFPVIASEAEHSFDVFNRLIRRKAVSHLQFCIPLVRGFTGALRLDEWALSGGIQTTPQCFSTVVAQAATLHFSAARSNVVSAEFHCFHDYLKALYVGDAGSIKDGYAEAGSGGGLNITIPELGEQPDGSVISSVVDVWK
ncbi:mandelate racemase/muconate lactonizing enzyme family protein [Stutzerimonas chloritidismutans]|uniref:mandelate racemase/muconate lactonizing enzyme family protein n=1 Tax=Stutzerimonas chloritidismutans TaxID=203192 RepID=UPI003F13C483